MQCTMQFGRLGTRSGPTVTSGMLRDTQREAGGAGDDQIFNSGDITVDATSEALTISAAVARADTTNPLLYLFLIFILLLVCLLLPLI